MRHGTTLALVLLIAAVSGCSIAGTWKTVSIEPLEAAEDFHFSTVTFGNDNMYTGKAKYDGEEVTSTGRYDWDGMTLKVQPDEGSDRTYQAVLWWGRQLVLKHQQDGQTVSARMERQ